MAVDTMGHLPALHVTPADEHDRAAVGALAGGRRTPRATASRWPMWTRRFASGESVWATPAR